MRTLSISLILLVALWSCDASAQLVWKQIVTPAPVTQFVTSPDGSLYFSSGDQKSRGLYYSSNRGVDWVKMFEGRIDVIECDSSGTLFLADSLIRLSHDHGITWTVFDRKIQWYSGMSHLAFSDQAIYHASPNGFVARSTDGGTRWDTVAVDLKNEADWAGLYAANGDRIVAATGFDGSFQYREAGQSIHDTDSFTRLCQMDNDPIYNAVFTSDGYTYIWHCSRLARLPVGSKRWEIYKDSVGYGPDPQNHIPLASIGAALVSVEREGTYLSTDHGDTWTQIGSGIATSYPRGLDVVFTNTGHGYAVMNDTLYGSDYFAAVEWDSKGVAALITTPSPVHSILRVAAESVRQIQVLSITGAIVDAPYRVTSTGVELDVRNLAPSVYSAAVTSAGGVVRVVRFVKE